MPAKSLPLVIIAIFSALLSVALVLFGLPEAIPAQSVALELSALPLAITLAAADLFLLQRAAHVPVGGARIALIVGAVVSVVGLVLMALAYLSGPRSLVSFGQCIVFVGLLVVLVVAVTLRARPAAEWFHLEASTDPAEPQAARLPSSADQDSEPSL